MEKMITMGSNSKNIGRINRREETYRIGQNFGVITTHRHSQSCVDFGIAEMF